ncbi:conserved hypothetical protein [Planktothrix sp. PCC 11201]|uniref:hypothetical protein n=1 Tax=Planktothrix sp. PCC 11201 TaxID=1729650 RepID=UPI00091D4CDF|nr:hypothetical protein [Planktothrix sp. PCC 11201]SKB12138.1 conserved hypothetical protein [Planktothrix sp. PCC 11201]
MNASLMSSNSISGQVLIQVPSQTQTSQVPPPNLTLIDQKGQDLVEIGAVLLAISLILVIRLLSKKVEYALIFAAIVTAILVPLLWFL